MEVNAVMPSVPKYLNWSEQEVNWSCNDHPKVMPTPGGMLWLWIRHSLDPRSTPGSPGFSLTMGAASTSCTGTQCTRWASLRICCSQAEPWYCAGCLLCTHGHSLGRRLVRHQGEQPDRKPLVRGRGPRKSIPCLARQAGIGQVHEVHSCGLP